MNQVSLVGRITKDSELRKLQEGRVQTNFILAVNRNYKNQNGEIEADFVFCTAWGRLADNVVKYCGKGSLIGVSGRLQSRSYQKEDGKRIYITEVIGEDVRFLVLKDREGIHEKVATDARLTKQQASVAAEFTKEFHLPNTEKEKLPIV
ncbi:single-stranded DNA-binding protein [Viridibacillus sp. FSL H8-0123]|uniref:single-stranded DNA-binding protein n=1 Tax=Viridibacillus sp. FSL H8-0123 TaxID=1928922 RepID=UPI00096F8303|nr:single-stranded DNA-binding protein [Viridibacillus sp. FSL H8-0123]OMC80218.1 single-stranded DNA-binding protein [Viridibacillus sp. FSL H8-0123]